MGYISIVALDNGRYRGDIFVTVRYVPLG